MATNAAKAQSRGVGETLLLTSASVDWLQGAHLPVWERAIHFMSKCGIRTVTGPLPLPFIPQTEETVYQNHTIHCEWLGRASRVLTSKCLKDKGQNTGRGGKGGEGRKEEGEGRGKGEEEKRGEGREGEGRGEERREGREGEGREEERKGGEGRQEDEESRTHYSYTEVYEVENFPSVSLCEMDTLATRCLPSFTTACLSSCFSEHSKFQDIESTTLEKTELKGDLGLPFLPSTHLKTQKLFPFSQRKRPLFPRLGRHNSHRNRFFFFRVTDGPFIGQKRKKKNTDFLFSVQF